MEIRKWLSNSISKQAPINYGSKGYGAIMQSQAPARQGLESFLRAYSEDPWVHGVMSRIDSAVAESKWHLYDSPDINTRKEIAKHEVLDLWNRPNPSFTASDQLELTQLYLDATGKAYWVKVQSGAKSELWIVPSPYIHAITHPTKFITGYHYERGNEKADFKIEEVVPFVHYDPLNIFDGVGPLQSLDIDLGVNSFMRQHVRNWFYNNAEPGTIISYPGDMPQGEMDRLKEKVNQEHRGYGRAHKIMIVSGGAKVDKAEVGRKDMDFAGLAKWERDIILGCFGMPGVLLGVTENANRAIAQTAEYTFARWVIKPRLEFIRRKVNEFLLPDYGDGLNFDFEDPTPKDDDAQSIIAQRMVEAGICTIDEARSLTNLDPLENKTGEVFKIGLATQLMPQGGEVADTTGEATATGDTAENIAEGEKLNGIQITASLQVINDFIAGTIPESVAIELLVAVGIDRERATVMIQDSAKFTPKEQPKEPIPPQFEDDKKPFQPKDKPTDTAAEIDDTKPEAKPEKLSFKAPKRGAAHELIVRHAAKYEPMAQKALKKMWAEQEKEVLSKLPATKDTVLFDAHKARHQYINAMKPILTEAMGDSIKNAADLLSVKGIPFVLNAASVKWLLTRLGWAADAISEESASQLSTLMSNAFAAGRSTPQIAQEIKGLFAGWGETIDTARSMRIARTEIIQAAAQGTLEGYKSMGVEFVEFSAAPDACEACLDAEAEFNHLSIDDAEGVITIHPSCRCAWSAVVE